MKQHHEWLITMEYLPSIEIIMNLAVRESTSAEFAVIETEHLFVALLKFAELDENVGQNQLGDASLEADLRNEIAGLKTIVRTLDADPAQLRRIVRRKLGKGGVPYTGGTIHRSESAKQVFSRARDMARNRQESRLTAVHLLLAMVQRPSPFLRELLPTNPFIKAPIGPIIANEQDENRFAKPERTQIGPDLATLSEAMDRLRDNLRGRIFGQLPAVLSFVRGLFNAELPSELRPMPKRPKAAFLFIGPAGSGKLATAQVAAEALGREMRHFDAAGFSEDVISILTGTVTEHEDPRPGILTGFVHAAPDAFVYFENLENAQPGLIGLLARILDTGALYDPALEKTVDFSKSVIILATASGRGMYESTRGAEVFFDDETFFRNAVIRSLAQASEGSPSLAEAMISRCGYLDLVLFRALGAGDRIRMSAEVMHSVCSVLLAPYDMGVEIHPEVPLLFLLREGLPIDRKTIALRSEAFVRTELFNFISLLSPEHLPDIMKRSSKLVFELENASCLPEELSRLVAPKDKPRVLAVCDEQVGRLWSNRVHEITWTIAPDIARVQEALASQSIDMVLVDPLIQEPVGTESVLILFDQTVDGFDHVPGAARSVALGMEILRKIRASRPAVPCFLVLTGRGYGPVALDRKFADDCARIGATKGVIKWEPDANRPDAAGDEFSVLARKLAKECVIEKKLTESRSPNWGIAFDTAPIISSEDSSVRIRIRNVRPVERPAAGIVTDEVHSAPRVLQQGPETNGAPGPAQQDRGQLPADSQVTTSGEPANLAPGQAASKPSGQEYTFRGWEDGTLRPLAERPSQQIDREAASEAKGHANSEWRHPEELHAAEGEQRADVGPGHESPILQWEQSQAPSAQSPGVTSRESDQVEQPVNEDQSGKEHSPSMFFKWED